MPEWVVQFVAATLVAALGWLIVNKLNRIDRKLDRYEERQAKVERDCVTWKQLEHEFEEHVKPLRTTVEKLDRAVVGLRVACEQRHK